MTLLSPSQVTWNQVQGSTNVGSQLCKTLSGSFTALLNAYRASPVIPNQKKKLVFFLKVKIFWSKGFCFLPSRFAFPVADRWRRRRCKRIKNAIFSNFLLRKKMVFFSLFFFFVGKNWSFVYNAYREEGRRGKESNGLLTKFIEPFKNS